MKYLLLFIAFSFTSCLENNKDIQSNTSPAVNSLEIKDQDSRSNVIEDERSNWQKPQYVIKSLGDLSGKTVADIGSGALGYFVIKLVGQTEVDKLIAVDIDKEAVKMLNILKSALSKEKSDKIDIRLAEANDPKLKDQEVDIILIVNTIAFIPNRLQYLHNLKSKLKENGRIIIIDFKTKRIPDFVDAPIYKDRIYLNILEEELYQVGYNSIFTDDTSLEYQFYISAKK